MTDMLAEIINHLFSNVWHESVLNELKLINFKQFKVFKRLFNTVEWFRFVFSSIS